MKFYSDKPVRTIDGRPVQIWARDGQFLYGAIIGEHGDCELNMWCDEDGCEVSFTDPKNHLVNIEPRYLEGFLNYWADYYNREHVWNYLRVTLVEFLEHPNFYHRKMVAGDFELLPKQADVQRRLLIEELANRHQSDIDSIPDLQMRDGVFVEPLKHHSHAR